MTVPSKIIFASVFICYKALKETKDSEETELDVIGLI